MTIRSGEIEAQDRRRLAVSFGLTMLLYIVSLGGLILAGILLPKQILIANKTVTVSLLGPEAAQPGLGSIIPMPEGADKPIDAASAPPKAPEPVKTPPPKPAPKPKAKTQATVPPPVVAKTPPQSKTPTVTIPVASVKPVPEVPVTPAPASAETTPATTVPAPASPVEPWVPGLRPTGSRVSGETTIVKAEKGNAMETTLGGAQGTVGQNIYVPIYLAMPLPRELPRDTLNKIPAQIVPPNIVTYTAEARQRAFRMYYELSGGVWKLKASVPLEQREPLWSIIEDTGYDAALADYKTGRNLTPVVIGFTVTRELRLSNVELLQSSGDPVVDESVIFGFKRGAFWNKTGDAVSGKFTYRF